MVAAGRHWPGQGDIARPKGVFRPVGPPQGRLSRDIGDDWLATFATGDRPLVLGMGLAAGIQLQAAHAAQIVSPRRSRPAPRA